MIDYLSQLVHCPQCGAGRQVIEPDPESDDDGATIITVEGLYMDIIRPNKGTQGIIEYIRCSKCGYEGPLVWCKKGFSHRRVSEAWNDHITPLAKIKTCDLVRELEKRVGDNHTTVLKGWEYSLEKTPPEENEDENLYNYGGDESDNPGMWTSISGIGPAKILVVVD